MSTEPREALDALSRAVSRPLPLPTGRGIRDRLGRWLAERELPALPIRWRMTLWYTLVLALTLAVFSLVVYWFMGRTLIRSYDQTTRERATQVAQSFRQIYQANNTLPPYGVLELAMQGILPQSLNPYQSAGVQVRFYDPSGDQRWPPPPELLRPQDRFTQDMMFLMQPLVYQSDWSDVLRTSEGTFYAYSMPVHAENGALIGAVQVLTPLGPYENTMELLALVLAAGTALATALAFGISMALSHAALAPIGAIVRTAEQINRAQDLSRRVPERGVDDEIGRLTRTINDMLDRIQGVFDRQRQFMADVSHELRTPLTTIRGELDLMARRGCADEEPLEAMSSEAERMSRMVSDLMLLARTEQEVAIDCEPLELDTLVLDVYRQTRLLAGKTHTVRLGHEDAATVQGDRDKLKQLLLNLVSNALKHTPADTTVTLSLYRDPETARLVVTDDGPGIPEAHLPHLFERFYRVDKARARASGGSGLGLSIVAWVANAHGGAVDVESTPGEGTRFIVRLPLAQDRTS